MVISSLQVLFICADDNEHNDYPEDDNSNNK